MPTTDREYLAQTAALLAARAVSLNLSQGSHVAASDAVALHRIATRLHHWQENNCNGVVGVQAYPPGSRGEIDWDAWNTFTEKRDARWTAKAQTIADRYQLRVYIQDDPRGCPLYLIPNEKGPQSEDDSNYNSRGHAVCHMGR